MRNYKTPRYSAPVRRRPMSAAQKAKISASARARAAETRATARCDFCLTVTGNVRRFNLVTAVSTPEARSRSKNVPQGSVLACQDCWGNFGLRCDMCGETWREAPSLRKYRLTTHRTIAPGSYETKAVGQIVLCLSCWKRTAGTRTKNRPVAGRRRIVGTPSDWKAAA